MTRSRLLALAVVIGTLASGLATSAPALAQEPGPPRPVTWMAAGDSFSSGEGTTDPDEPCQRSRSAWARVAHESHLPAEKYDEPVFVACTGAHLDHLRGVQADMLGRSQVDQAHDEHDGRFDLVTFSLGGNDVDFGGTVKDCIGVDWRDASDWGLVLIGSQTGPIGRRLASGYAVGCDITEEEMKARIDERLVVNNDLAEELTYLAEEIVTPRGHVLVVGYPHLIEDAQRWPAWRRLSGRCSGVRASDVPRLRGATGYMNEKLKAITETARHDEVTFSFVDINGRVFETDGGRHGLCSETPWLNDIIDAALAGRLDRAFHPNDAGHAAEGEHVASRISGLDWTGLAPGYEDLTHERWGPIRFGMTLEEASDAGVQLSEVAIENETANFDFYEHFACGHFRVFDDDELVGNVMVNRDDDGVEQVGRATFTTDPALITDDEIARPPPLPGGLRFGISRDEVLDIARNQGWTTATQPAEYDGDFVDSIWLYPDGPNASRALRILVEHKGSQGVEPRGLIWLAAGVQDPVSYVEGCV